MARLRAEKDFYAGLLYLVVAVAFLWFGRTYKIGTAAQMGPGYFPIVLACMLAALGAISIFRSFLTDGERVDALSWRPLLLITVACIAFGFLLAPAGLIIALSITVLVSAAASRQSVYDFKGLLVLASLILFCVLVFVKGLGVPMPIFGYWFDGLLPATWQR
jgi:hypothetical protein